MCPKRNENLYPDQFYYAFLFVVADIGANLTDGMYRGEYHGGSKKHEPDLEDVLERSWKEGLTHIIVTGGSVRSG